MVKGLIRDDGFSSLVVSFPSIAWMANLATRAPCQGRRKAPSPPAILTLDKGARRRTKSIRSIDGDLPVGKDDQGDCPGAKGKKAAHARAAGQRPKERL